MANLYELTEGYRNLLELLDNTDIPQDIIEKALNEAEGNIEEKIENIAKLIKSIGVDVKGLKEEEDRLSARRKALENRITNLKTYAEDSMRLLGKDKVKGKLFTLSISKNPPSLNVKDIGAIPLAYFIPQEPELDKKKLLQDLKNGEVIEGAEMIQKEGLRIR